jgi:hypothetical protein
MVSEPSGSDLCRFVFVPGKGIMLGTHTHTHTHTYTHTRTRAHTHPLTEPNGLKCLWRSSLDCDSIRGFDSRIWVSSFMSFCSGLNRDLCSGLRSEIRPTTFVPEQFKTVGSGVDVYTHTYTCIHIYIEPPTPLWSMGFESADSDWLAGRSPEEIVTAEKAVLRQVYLQIDR